MAYGLSGWKQEIKAEAYNLGFSMVGVTTAEPPPHLDVYARWLQAGRHGGMAYLARESAHQRRADPRLILPETRSILVVGARYPSPSALAPPAGSQPFGRVASYAWGVDYHIVLKNQLGRLAEAVQQITGRPISHKAYTDTGPILEKELAQRAGLGWISKNTCLMAPRHGSYDLLGELFLDHELEPDPPYHLDACGSCQRCIQACPTQCILPDRTLDASRCISYLTIENKGPIGRGLRASVANWVFGCDVCQSVCPWNIRFADHMERHPGVQTSTVTNPPPEPSLFSIQQDIPFPDLIQELALTPEMFNQKFSHSPIQRPRRRGYLRNVAIALGNSGDPEGLPALAAALVNDPEALIRGAAAWAAGQIRHSSSHPVLQKALSTETDPGVIEEIRSALEEGIHN